MSFKGKMILLILFIFVIVTALLVWNTATIEKASKEHKGTVTQVEEQKQETIQKEKLELTQDSIELEVGAVFDFKQYIKVAENKYGYSVKDQIKVEGEIPTDKEGEYQVEYVMDLGNGKRISRILKVTVRKF